VPSESKAGPLDGIVALVTGASSGIGEATALALARCGAHVAVAARRRDRLESLAASMPSSADCLVVEADVTKEESARAMVDATVQRFERLDVLVNNAGVMLLGPVADAEVSDWERMVNLNLLGLMYSTRAALPHLLSAAQTGPRRVSDLVNVSSVAGRVALKGSAAYNATKFGVVAFSEALRKEVTGQYIRVSLVEPGGVATELMDHMRPDIRDGMRARLDQIEILQPDDVAAAIMFGITRPRHVAISEVLIRPTQQET